jgi:hypothetical protein
MSYSTRLLSHDGDDDKSAGKMTIPPDSTNSLSLRLWRAARTVFKISSTQKALLYLGEAAKVLDWLRAYGGT